MFRKSRFSTHNGWRIKPAKLIVLVSALFGVFACTPSPYEASSERYLARIANILEIEQPTVSVTTLETARLKALDIPSQNISMTTLLELRRCHLDTLIAERNSVLGKVAAPSVHFYYESKLISGIVSCLTDKPESLESDTLTMLEEVLTIKQAQLIGHFLNIFAQEETFQSLVEAAPVASSSISATHINRAIVALKAINQVHQKILNNEALTSQELVVIENSLIELHEINRSKGIATLAATLAYQNHTLERATAMLVQLDALNCSASKSSEKATYMMNVLSEYFINDVQAQMGKVYHAWDQVALQLKPLYSSYLQNNGINNVQFEAFLALSE